jgi:hypothetical protein
MNTRVPAKENVKSKGPRVERVSSRYCTEHLKAAVSVPVIVGHASFSPSLRGPHLVTKIDMTKFATASALTPVAEA